MTEESSIFSLLGDEMLHFVQHDSSRKEVQEISLLSGVIGVSRRGAACCALFIGQGLALLLPDDQRMGDIGGSVIVPPF